MGKSCCHLEDDTDWEHIREICFSQIPIRLETLRQELKAYDL